MPKLITPTEIARLHNMNTPHVVRILSKAGVTPKKVIQTAKQTRRLYPRDEAMRAAMEYRTALAASAMTAVVAAVEPPPEPVVEAGPPESTPPTPETQNAELVVKLTNEVAILAAKVEELLTQLR